MRKKQSKMKTRMCPFLDENCVKGSNEFKINRKQAELISSLESNSFALGRFQSSLLLPGISRICIKLESSSP